MNHRIEIPNKELFKFKHGLKRHLLYQVWGKIKERCFKVNSKDYSYYGGRGIDMYEHWVLDFKPFYDWCIENGWRKGLEIDRENNHLGYHPSNCRFVTRSGNMRNTRRNNMITYKGDTKCLAEWAEILGMNRYTLFNRISRLGWTVEESFETPLVK